MFCLPKQRQRQQCDEQFSRRRLLRRPPSSLEALETWWDDDGEGDGYDKDDDNDDDNDEDSDDGNYGEIMMTTIMTTMKTMTMRMILNLVDTTYSVLLVSISSVVLLSCSIRSSADSSADAWI